MSCDSVFQGPTALREFLNPCNHPPIPLVELPASLNRFAEAGVRVFAKALYLTPLLNLKTLPILRILLAAEERGQLADVHTFVENSSGNTAFSLAVMANLFGIRRTQAFVPFDIAPGKLDLLRLAGAEVQFKRGTPDELSGIEEAKQRSRQPGYFCPTQYENEWNPAAYEEWVAPQIWEQLKHGITVFAAGLGTTGTMLGCSRFFRRQQSPVHLVGSICAPNHSIPGVRSEARLKEIAFDWRASVDSIEEVETKPSFRCSLNLCRCGIMAGPSSGFALQGLLQYLECAEKKSTLDKLRNSQGEVVAVFVCCDTPLPYLDKYSTHLDAEQF